MGDGGWGMGDGATSLPWVGTRLRRVRSPADGGIQPLGYATVHAPTLNQSSIICTQQSSRTARGAVPTLNPALFRPAKKEWCSRWDSNPNRRLRRPEFYPLKYESVPPSKQAEHKGVKYFPKSSIWRAFLHPSSPHPSHPSRGQAPAPSARGRRRCAGPCGSDQAR